MVDNERELYRAHQDGLRHVRLFSPRCDGGRDRIRSEPDAGCTTCGRTRTARRRRGVVGLELLSRVSAPPVSQHLALHSLELLRAQGGTHVVAVDVIRKALSRDIDLSATSLARASRLLIAGAICFVLWHVGQLQMRSLVPTAPEISSTSAVKAPREERPSRAPDR